MSNRETLEPPGRPSPPLVEDKILGQIGQLATLPAIVREPRPQQAEPAVLHVSPTFLSHGWLIVDRCQWFVVGSAALPSVWSLGGPRLGVTGLFIGRLAARHKKRSQFGATM